MKVWDIISIIVAAVLLIAAIIIMYLANKQFRDKSIDIKEGMDEGQVIKIMEKDPLSIDRLKDGKYIWTFEKKDYKAWGMRIITIYVHFNSQGKVTQVERNISHDRPGMKKD